jgi:uncharacterized iron-regulated membrane protein
VFRPSDASELRDAVDAVFDYRGDVTLELRDGSKREGYVFDRADPARSDRRPALRLILKDSGERVKVPYADVVTIEVTGRDTAAGKSWETWVKNYHAKKARGERADLLPDTRED